MVKKNNFSAKVACLKLLLKDKYRYGDSIFPGGGEINNEDMTITQNGMYSADAGYTGIGTVTVDVPEGAIVTATNTTGSAISSGDKVWLEKVSGGWNIIDPEIPVRNFTTVGAVTINDITGVASSDERSKYITHAQDYDFTKSWEFKTKVDYGSYRYYSAIYSGNDSTQSALTSAGFSLRIAGSSDGNRVQFFSTGPDILTANSSITSNKTYYIKCGWDGVDTYYVSLSNDGQSWTTTTATSSTPITQSDNAFVLLGSTWTSQDNFHGSMYLKDTSMSVDGKVVWTPYVSFTKYFMGFAEEAIANNASGEVKTVLPEQVSV